MPAEKNKILDLILSGQEANIELGLTLAASLKIEGEIEEMLEVFFDSKLQEKIGTKNILGLASVHICNHFAQTQLEELPPGIRCLKRLTILHLEHNRLKYLPDELAQLENLAFLHLQNNAFCQFPKVLTQLPKLHSLFINRNQITHLPPEIGNCEKLTILSLNSNKLTTLPIELLKLKQLDQIFLADNPWDFEAIPQAFFDPNIAPKAVFEELKKLRK